MISRDNIKTESDVYAYNLKCYMSLSCEMRRPRAGARKLSKESKILRWLVWGHTNPPPIGM